MNLNEFVIKRRKQRGNRNILAKLRSGQTEFLDDSPNNLTKKQSTSVSSEINWGKSHISITNSSMSKKSTTSRKTEDLSSRIIVALTEGRGEARCEVGIAVISASMPFLILCQISDSQNYINTLTKINIFNPSVILVPATFVERYSGNRLINKVKERFPNLKYIGVPRSTYNKINGFEMLNNLCIPSLNGILLVLQHRYYALAAASALLCYIQDHLFIYYAAGTIKVDYQESEGYAVIDVSTADNLELVSSTRPAQSNKYASLFGVLNHCQTKTGARMLRSMILQPPFKVEYIENRLRCVNELIQNPDTLASIQVLLAKMSNVDSLLSIGTMISNDPLKNSTSQLNYVLRLNHFLDLITPLKENLEQFTEPFFVQIKETLANEGFTTIKNTLRETIQEDAQPARGNGAILQRCFVIKPGINGLLDLVRKTYTERMNDLKEYVKSLAEKHDLALTLGNNQTKGFHIVLNFNNAQRKSFRKSTLPDEFIEVHSSTGCCTMKTPELVNLSTRLDDIMNDILKISNVMVHAIIVDIKKYVHLFYIVCEEIAQLDVIQSLASTSLINSYVRPNFSKFTEINSARHPLLEVLLSHSNLVPNHISCSDDFNVNIVTGPNGSGKSVFIRQVLLLQIMAQIGCYVPAQSAVFKPMDRMFARIYLEDNMEFGASSFILEMKEMKYIMTSLTDNSLVIIDELGRSTALEEGTALAIAILEKLSNSTAYIYINTHFTLLTRLYDMYPYVKIWQLETIPKDKNTEKCQLDYKYNVLPGVTSIKHYGVTLVRGIWPEGILKYVDCLLDKLSKRQGPNIKVLDEMSRLKYGVESLFRKLKHQNELTISRIYEILTQYQKDLNELGYDLNIHPLLESYLQENSPLVEENLVATRKVDQNTELERFLDDSNSVYQYQNYAYHNMENNLNISQGSSHQNFFEPDVFKKPLQPKICIDINSAHTHIEEDSNYEESIQSSQQTPTVALSDDMDGHKFMSLCNDQSKTSTPIHLFDNICHYSSSSDSQQVIDVLQTSHNLGNVSNSCILAEADQKSLDGYTYRNQYEHYISPEVIIAEGLNNTSISWEDQSDDRFSTLKGITGNKINIISDVKIQSGFQKSTEGNENNFHNLNTNLEKSPIHALIRQSPISNEKNYNVKHKIMDVSENDLNISNASTFQIDAVSDDIGPINSSKMSRINDSINEINSSNKKNKTYSFKKKKYIHCIPKSSALPNSSENRLNFSHRSDLATSDERVTYTNVFNDSLPSKSGGSISNEGISNTPNPNNTNSNNTCCNISGIEDKTSSISMASKLRRLDEDATASSTSNDLQRGSDVGKNVEKSSFVVNENATTVSTTCFSTSTAKNISLGDESGQIFQTSKDKTSVSYASALRNLDESASADDISKKHSSSLTTFSKASNKTNLDNASCSSDTASTVQTTDISEPKADSRQPELGVTKKYKLTRKRKFIPPMKPSAKEIEKEFEEQDRKILESSQNSSDMKKYWEHIINRPTVQQIRQSTHLALVRKTNEGVQVFPAEQKKPRRKSPIKRQFSNERFDMSIFSDNNAKTFEEYLNSGERDYKTFRSTFTQGDGENASTSKFPFGCSFNLVRNDENKFVVSGTTTTFHENNISQHSIDFNQKRSIRFTPKMSSEQNSEFNIATFNATLQNNRDASIKAQKEIVSLTPNGYYKQNKDHINNIMNKYLHNTSNSSRFGCNDIFGIKERKNIFENTNVSIEDIFETEF